MSEFKQGYFSMSWIDRRLHGFVRDYMWRNYGIDIRRWNLTPEHLKEISILQSAAIASRSKP